MAPVDFTGTWKLEKSENDEDFFKLLAKGANVLKQAGIKMMSGFKPTMIIKQDGDKLDFEMKMPLKSIKIVINVGQSEDREEFGSKYKSVSVWEGDTLKSEMEPQGGKGFKHTQYRSFDEDKILVMMVIVEPELTVKRWFSRES